MVPGSHDSKKSKNNDRLLTGAELELMHMVWANGEATVKSILDCLPSSRKLAYTSVSTILRILEKKGFLTSVKSGRAHIYQPLMDRETYEQRSLAHMVDNVFQGEALQLASRFIDSTPLDADELDSLRRLLEEKKPRC